MFKVIALPRLRNLTSAQALCDADSRACSKMLSPLRGVPRTDAEWTALVRIASGERDIPPSQCARLLALGLVERNAGGPTLTRHGRLTLGLAE
jgi:hypothetical protein